MWFLGLQQAHLLSLLLVAIALGFLVTRVRLTGSADSGGDGPDEGDDADAEVDSEEGQADAPPGHGVGTPERSNWRTPGESPGR